MAALATGCSETALKRHIKRPGARMPPKRKPCESDSGVTTTAKPKKSRKAKSKSEMEGEVMGDDEEAMMEALEEEQLLRDAAAKVVKPPAAAAPSASDSAEVANAKANAAPAVQIGAPAGFEWGETF